VLDGPSVAVAEDLAAYQRFSTIVSVVARATSQAFGLGA